MEEYINADIIKDVKIFNDEILKDLRNNYDKYQIKKAFEDRINCKLIDPNDLYNKNLPKDISQTIAEESETLRKQYNISYTKLIHNKYEFIKLKDNKYYIDLKEVSNKCSIRSFTTAIEDISGLIFQERLIQLINKVNYIQFLEKLNVDQHKESKYSDYIKNLVNVFYVRSYWFAIISLLLLVLLFLFITDRRIEISSTSQQNIALTIIGTLTSLLGFAVVFFQLSFDNLKKTYGSYARTILLNAIGNELIYTFVIILVFAIVTAIFEKENYTIIYTNVKYYVIQNFSFNLTVTLFFIFIVKLLKKLAYIFNYSLSNENLKQIIDSIALNSVEEIKSNYFNDYDVELILKSHEFNHIEILSEISTNSILQNNHRIVEVIVVYLTKHISNIVEKLSLSISESENSTQDIVYAYNRIIYRIIDTTFKSFHRDLIITIYTNISNLNFIIATHKSNANTLTSVLDLLDFSIKKSLSANTKEDFSNGISCYKTCLKAHLLFNTPYDYDIHSDSPYFHTIRREIYLKNSYHWNQLLIYSTHHFYDLTVSCINKYSDIDGKSLINLINHFRSLFNDIVLYKHDSRSLRYQLIEILSSYTLTLYKESFKKNVFDSRLFIYAPFNVVIISNLISYDSNIYHLILRNYISWCLYIIEEFKIKEYVSDCVSGSIYIFQSQIKYIEEMTNELKQNEVDNSYRAMNTLIDAYNNIDYSVNKFEREIVSEINSRFWTFRQFEINPALNGNIFYQKLDQVIDKTVWANTTV